MDVTPHDLRNAELREAFRGYRPEEVEELLERAAVTLERMHERNRQLQEKIAGLEAAGSTAKEMESVLRQTLLLAQRTADETVTTAHDRARLLAGRGRWAVFDLRASLRGGRHRPAHRGAGGARRRDGRHGPIGNEPPPPCLTGPVPTAVEITRPGESAATIFRGHSHTEGG